MGKFTKGCLAIAGIFLGIGLLIGVIVSATAGRSFIRVIGDHQVSWLRNLEFRPFNGWFHGWDWNWGWNWDWDDGVWNDGVWNGGSLEVNNKTVNGNWQESDISGWGIDRLDISLAVGEFILKEGDGADYRVEIRGVGECAYRVDDGCLYLDGFREIYGDISNNKITLYVPKDVVYDWIRIDVGAGRSEMAGIRANELECEVGMGSASFHRMDVADLELDTGMGHTTFNGRADGKVSVSCSLGAVELNLDGRAEDYNYSLECTTGSISLNGRDYAALAGSTDIDNDARYDMELECAGGSIAVRVD